MLAHFKVIDVKQFTTISLYLQALADRAAVRLPLNYDEYERIEEAGWPTIPIATHSTLGCTADRQTAYCTQHRGM